MLTVFLIQLYSIAFLSQEWWNLRCPPDGRIQNHIDRCPDPLDIPDVNQVCPNGTVALYLALCENATYVRDDVYYHAAVAFELVYACFLYTWYLLFYTDWPIAILGNLLK
jgi:hypothetical protein